uniref:Uncharacterized protein n=1 Tax=Cyprinus carpio TaxID=7962 RepID=A0A8C2JIR6_CYPCA
MYPKEILDPVSQDEVISFTEEAVSILTSSSMLARSFHIHPRVLKHQESSETDSRINTKKHVYCRINNKAVENKVLALLENNACLKAELLALKFKFGLIKDPTDSPAQICSFGSHNQTFSVQNYGFFMPGRSSIGSPEPHTMPACSTAHQNNASSHRHTESHSAIRFQISALTEEVAQLKKPLSQHQLSKVN